MRIETTVRVGGSSRPERVTTGSVRADETPAVRGDRRLRLAAGHVRESADYHVGPAGDLSFRFTDVAVR